MSPEQLFSESRLEILIPDERVNLKSLDTASETWWTTLVARPQRSLAFFDERLYMIFAVRIPKDPGPLDAYFQRLQVSLEASYISPFIPSSSPRTTPTNANYPQSQTLSASNSLRLPAPLLPPSTPNPIPSTSTPDQPYARSDPGVTLQSYTWGEVPPGPIKKTNVALPDDFVLAWSSEEDAWIALFELHVSVTFLRTRVSEPLLCLTVSATLRDQPLPQTEQRRQIQDTLVSKNLTPLKSDETDGNGNDDELDDIMYGMEEVNLLDILNDGITFNPPNDRLSLTTARIGSDFRQEGFSLPPVSSGRDSFDINQSTSRSSAAILRKSFRKTLRTVSGVKVRMRNCFVPYLYIPTSGLVGKDDAEEEERAAGSEERTVILSVEVENSSESGVGFVIDNIKVSVSGDNPRTTLIGWGENQDANELFPFTLTSNNQVNLLYAVSFLTAPDAPDPASLRKRDSSSTVWSEAPSDAMQRHVAIIVDGHPFRPTTASTTSLDGVHLEPFSSRWNCILDLHATQQADPHTWYSRPTSPLSARDALPTPASPYPASTFVANVQMYDGLAPTPTIAGNRGLASLRIPRGPSSPVPMSASPSIPTLSGAVRRTSAASGLLTSYITPGGKFVPSPPSAMVAAMGANSNSNNNGAGSPTPRSDRFPAQVTAPPLTPAFPSYGTEMPPSPYSQSPLGSDASVSVAVIQQEPRRERMGSGIVPTVGDLSRAAASAGGNGVGGYTAEGEGGTNILVSVSLLPPRRTLSSSSSSSSSEDEDVNDDDDAMGGQKARTRRTKKDSIYPMDVFSLEIFVLNRSSIVRRCEVGFPERKRRRAGGSNSPAGIMPLDNRIRVGPLLPGTCQSVRMHLLALTPGVHMIDTLTLSDVGMDYTINLRSVMNVIVEDPAVVLD